MNIYINLITRQLTTDKFAIQTEEKKTQNFNNELRAFSINLFVFCLSGNDIFL